MAVCSNMRPLISDGKISVYTRNVTFYLAIALIFMTINVTAENIVTAKNTVAAENIAQPLSHISDLVLLNGTVYTVNMNTSWDQHPLQALAISGKRIVYVGDNKGARAYIGPGTEAIDLGGKMVLPGFIDAHIHPLTSAMLMAGVDLTDVSTSKDYIKKIKDYVDKNKDAKVIRGFGWNYPDFGVTGPTKELLDNIVSDKPVLLTAIDGHSYWVNSKALEMANITKDTPDPKGGKIERDPKTGEPSGTLRESACLVLISSKLPPLSRDEIEQGLAKALDMASSEGITTLHDSAVILDQIFAYSNLEKAGKLNVRVFGEMYCNQALGLDQIPYLVAERKNHSSDLFQLRGAKLFADGIIESHTGFLLEPYADMPGFRGTPVWDPEVFRKMISALDKEGFQIEVHCMGDGAVRMSLDALENARKENGPRDSRHKIAHIELISPNDVPRFKSLGVIPALQPIWFYYTPFIDRVTLPALGPERTAHIDPMKSLVDSGAVVACGTDWPLAIDYLTLRPLDSIRTGVVGLPLSKESNITKPFHPEERVDLKTMVEVATINGAYASFMENKTGSLNVGKLADLVVIDKDIFKMPAKDINNARVQMTVLEGREIFRDNSSLRSLGRVVPMG
jgi:predicted amidohydrolase YtcJ